MARRLIEQDKIFASHILHEILEKIGTSENFLHYVSKLSNRSCSLANGEYQYSFIIREYYGLVLGFAVLGSTADVKDRWPSLS